MKTMDVVNYSNFRKNMASVMDKENNDRIPIIITRGGDVPPSVLLSLDDYNALSETEYLLGSKANKKRLMESIKNVEEEKTVVMDIEDLIDYDEGED